METNTPRHITSSDANSTVTVTNAEVDQVYVTINSTSAVALTLQDGAGNVIGILKASIAEGTYAYPCRHLKGVKLVVPNGYDGDATVSAF